MPLKHHTETALVLVLAVLIILTGVLVSSLPLLPLGLVPWGIVFLATLLYPFSLYPLLRRHRADYEFRALHFAPATIAFVWFLIQTASLKVPGVLVVHQWFTWGHAFFPVTLSLVLLAAFCTHVLRRWIPRLAMIGGTFALFAGLAAATESGFEADRKLASLLWDGRFASRPLVVAVVPPPVPVGSGKNLAPSQDDEEEAWRARLREVESRSGATVSSALSASSGLPIASSSRAPVIASNVKPGRLPSSGAGMEVVAPMFAAAYLGVVHKRAKKRVRE